MNSPKEIDSNKFTYFGPNATHIVLVSSDGHEFIISSNYTTSSSTLMNMLTGPGASAFDEPNKINLDIESCVLQKACSYLIYKKHYSNQSDEIPPFKFEDEIACDLLMAADFFNC
ncbi:Elongin-C [Aphelenchoides bicaudatus]|nr:Elongin-C [Aphelenchoides bicaudatus]